MGLIEAILLGIQFKRLQKPLVFFLMLIGLVVFTIFGGAIVWALLSSIFAGEKQLALRLIGSGFGMLAISAIFFGLAWLCGHLIKRCFA